MSVKVIFKLDDTKKVVKNIKGIQSIMIRAGELAIGEIVKKWNKGKGGNNKTMKALTDKYRAKKKASGRRGIRDLNWTGDLYRSFITRREGSDKVALTFTNDAKSKAAANYNRDNNMMKVGRDIRNKVLDIINKGVMR